MNSKFLFPLIVLGGSLLTGCLKTRNDVKDTESRYVMQQQVTTMQKTNADANARLVEADERMRELIGRVEELENKIQTSQQASESSLKNAQMSSAEANQKILLLQESLAKMETQLVQMQAEMQSLKADHYAAVGAASAAKEKAEKAEKDPYQAGQELFAQKDWKKAILFFQKYRDENPKGKNFADATYKIGVSFQELGMKDEARTFYDEVVGNYSKSEAAKKAKQRLKALK